MAFVTSNCDFSDKLCKALGIEARKVRSIRVIVEPDSIVRAVVDCEVDEPATDVILDAAKAGQIEVCNSQPCKHERTWRRIDGMTRCVDCGLMLTPPRTCEHKKYIDYGDGSDCGARFAHDNTEPIIVDANRNS